MSLRRNSDLIELLHVEDGDSLTIRDVSDITNQPTGETKRITRRNMLAAPIGSPSFLGGATFMPLATPAAPTVVVHGATGTATWRYRITARSNTGETLASPEATITTGNATLSATNFNRISWAAVTGAVDYRVYRTTSGGAPATLGIIGTVTATTLDDTGQAGGGQAVPLFGNSGILSIDAFRLGAFGTNNQALGVNALLHNTTGSHNTAVGVDALLYNTTGGNNTAAGMNALYSNTTGWNNTAAGVNALLHNTAGSGNISLGPMNAMGDYAPAFDATTQNNTISMGSTATASAHIAVAWTVLSDIRDKIKIGDLSRGLEFVAALRPISYRMRESRDSDEAVGGLRYGFSAQEILELENDKDGPVVVNNDDPDRLRMTTEYLTPVLVKAIQEQQALIRALTEKITKLEEVCYAARHSHK